MPGIEPRGCLPLPPHPDRAAGSPGHHRRHRTAEDQARHWLKQAPDLILQQTSPLETRPITAARNGNRDLRSTGPASFPYAADRERALGFYCDQRGLTLRSPDPFDDLTGMDNA